MTSEGCIPPAALHEHTMTAPFTAGRASELLQGDHH